MLKCDYGRQYGVLIESLDVEYGLHAPERMPLDGRPLFFGELGGFIENIRGDVELADIVKQRGQPEIHEQPLGEAELLSECHRQDAHIYGMMIGVIVVVLDGGHAEKEFMLPQKLIHHRLNNALRPLDANLFAGAQFPHDALRE